MAKRAEFHEDFGRQEAPAGGSNRAFGLTVGGILAAIGLARWVLSGDLGWLAGVLMAAGLPLVLFGLVAANSLAPLNRAWHRLGLMLLRITNPILMGLIFYVTVTPIALIMRLAGKDPLHLKFDSEASSYWIDRRPPGPAPESMKNQF